MSERERTTWVAPAATRAEASPSRSMPIRTRTPNSAPRRMSRGLSPTVAANAAQSGRGLRLDLRVVRPALQALVLGPEDERERVPALLLEHALGFAPARSPWRASAWRPLGRAGSRPRPDRRPWAAAGRGRGAGRGTGPQPLARRHGAARAPRRSQTPAAPASPRAATTWPTARRPARPRRPRTPRAPLPSARACRRDRR